MTQQIRRSDGGRHKAGSVLEGHLLSWERKIRA